MSYHAMNLVLCMDSTVNFLNPYYNSVLQLILLCSKIYSHCIPDNDNEFTFHSH